MNEKMIEKEQRKNPFFEPYNTPHDTVPFDRIRTEDAALVREIQDGYKARLTFKSEPLRPADSFAIADASSGQVLFSAGDQP